MHDDVSRHRRYVLRGQRASDVFFERQVPRECWFQTENTFGLALLPRHSTLARCLMLCFFDAYFFTHDKPSIYIQMRIAWSTNRYDNCLIVVDIVYTLATNSSAEPCTSLVHALSFFQVHNAFLHFLRLRCVRNPRKLVFSFVRSDESNSISVYFIWRVADRGRSPCSI